MPKRVPTYASDADVPESRLDLSFEDSGKVQWFFAFVAMGRKNKNPARWV